MLAVFILCFTVNTIEVSASDTSNPQTGFGGTNVNAGGDGSGGEADENASAEGFSYLKTGYLVYLVSKEGTLTSKVWFVPYSSLPDDTVEKGYLKSKIGNQVCTKFYTARGGIKTATGGAFDGPSCKMGNYNFGTAMKNALLQMNSEGSSKVYDLILNVLGEDKMHQFKDNDERLIIEAVCWSAIEQGSTQQYLYTAKNAAEFNRDYNCSYLGGLWKVRMPRSGRFEFDECGLIAPKSYSATYAELLSNYAWGMIAFSPKDTITIENPEENTLDTVVKANELNYVFPDLKKDDNDGRKLDQHSQVANYGASDKWSFHTNTDTTTASVLKDGKWGVTETISGDIKADDTWYNASAGTAWLKRDEDKTFSSEVTCVKPGYAFMYSRALMKDQITICNYKGNGNSNKTFISERLGLTNFGHNGGTGAQGFIGEARLADTASSYYKFVPYATETWKERTVTGTDNKGTEDTSDDTPTYSDWVDKEQTHSNATENYIEYKLTHGADKYTPLLISPPSLNLGETTNPVYTVVNQNGAVVKAIFPANIGTVSFYPEVKYRMWIPKTDGNGYYATPTYQDVYCMGEKMRSSTGGTLHGYTLGFSAESGESNIVGSATGMKGKSIVDSAMTGTASFEFADNFEGTNKTQKYMQVCSQGSGFSTATTNNPVISVTSFTLDLYEGDVSTTGEEFIPADAGWSRPDAVGANKKFADALAGNLVSEVTMKKFDKSNHQMGGTDIPQYDISDTKINYASEIDSQIRIRVKDGAIDGTDKNNVIEKIADEYFISEDDAEIIWINWGIENQILNMLETKNHPSNGSSNKWYDEETECLAISVCKSTIAVGNILINDKVDYGASASQDTKSYNNLGTVGYQYRFFLSLGFRENFIEVDGQTYNLGENMYLIDNDEIKGARFLISNATTNNWIK